MVDMQLEHLKTEEEKKKKVIEENLKQREALKAMEEAREKLVEKKKLYNQAQKEKDAVAHKIEQMKREIEHQEQIKSEEIDKLYKRETDLYKYKFKIKDLKKSKHVLMHRAKEMQQSLEPKEEDIDKYFQAHLKRMKSLQPQPAPPAVRAGDSFIALLKQRNKKLYSFEGILTKEKYPRRATTVALKQVEFLFKCP